MMILSDLAQVLRDGASLQIPCSPTAYVSEQLHAPDRFAALMCDPVALAERGFPVVPVSRDGKLLAGSLFDAARDGVTAAKLFDLHPDAKIAIVDLRTEGEAQLALVTNSFYARENPGSLACDIDEYLARAPAPPRTDDCAIRDYQAELLLRLTGWVSFLSERAEQRNIPPGNTRMAGRVLTAAAEQLGRLIATGASDGKIDDAGRAVSRAWAKLKEAAEMDAATAAWAAGQTAVDLAAAGEADRTGPHRLQSREIEDSDIGGFIYDVLVMETLRREARNGSRPGPAARLACAERLAYAPGRPPETDHDF